MERLSVKERERIAELLADGAPFWRLCEEVHRSRHAIRRAVISLSKPPPRERKRSPLRLSPVEREEISRGLVAGLSLRTIAAGLGRSPSTVSREVARNGGRRAYRACRADRAALRRAHRPWKGGAAGSLLVSSRPPRQRHRPERATHAAASARRVSAGTKP